MAAAAGGAAKLSFKEIGSGATLGLITLQDDRLAWRDVSGKNVKEFLKSDVEALSWTVFGQRGYLKISLKEGKNAKFDGFAKSDYDTLAEFCKRMYDVELEKEKVSSDGANFGDVSLKDKTLLMTSVNGIPCFELKLDNVAQCVVPGNNRDELEIHFPENDGEKEEEGLVQITLHFPAGDEEDEETPAQEFQKDIMSTGVIRSITGDIIAEFTKDQGNFITPRGKYSIQMLSTYMHMQGAQYSYKIKYTDISKCYLLDKPDGLRMLFVIVLDKPIRQGSQKYQSLVIETNKIETTMKINLTEAEITKDYEGSDLKPELSAPLCNLYGKLFKILAQQTIFIPKQFSSFREEKSIRCTYKTSEGLLFPLTKSIIFVHKPTIIVNFDDIELVDFKRADQAGNAGARTFDIEITLKKKDVVGESKYLFVSVDRAEAQPLAKYFESKNVQVINPQNNDRKAKGMFVGMDGGDDDEEEDEEDDGDYKAGQSSGSENDSDDSGGSDEEEEGEKEAKPAKKRSAKAKTSPREKGAKREKKEKAPAGKKTKKPKDKDAPKRGMSAYMLFANQQRNVVKAEMPGLSMTDMSKELGIRWKALGPEDKEEYELMAKNDKERYEIEMAEYKAKKGADMEVDDADESVDSD